MSHLTPTSQKPSVCAFWRYRYLCLMILCALVLRALCAPWVMVSEADAVSKIIITKEWLRDPSFIDTGTWGPLQTYLLAGALGVWNDVVLSPIALTSLFAVGASVPFYLLVEQEWDAESAKVCTALFLVYPPFFRYSMMALTEAPFIFFLLLSMMLLARLRARRPSFVHAALAGTALTFAGALRYEAWLLLPFLALSLWRRWAEAAAFVVFGMSFPLYWMNGNAKHQGDALFGIRASGYWERVIEGRSSDVPLSVLVERVLYQPKALLLGLTPLVCALALWGLVRVARARSSKAVWALSVLMLIAAQVLKAAEGSLHLSSRFSVIAGVLLLPFVAEGLAAGGKALEQNFIRWALVLSVWPLSYGLSEVPLLAHGVDINPVSRLAADVQMKANVVEEQSAGGGGVIVDFFGWEPTYFVALHAMRVTGSVFVMPGGKHEPLQPGRWRAFLAESPTGTLVTTTDSPLSSLGTSAGAAEELELGGKRLRVSLVHSTDGIRILHYTVL